MKTETITEALTKLTARGAKTRFAESLGLTLNELQLRGRRGHKLIYIGDDVYTLNKVEEETLKKFGAM